jgi:hypothetical protein
MNRFLAGTLLVFSISCNSDKSQLPDAMASNNTQVSTLVRTVNSEETAVSNSEPYEIKFDIHQQQNDVYDFEVHMILHNDSQYVSPNAKRDFTGKFTIHIDDVNTLESIADLTETPRSVEEYDPYPFVNGTGNWVRENTKYIQKLRRTADDNFHVKGFIQFTIEPRCTLEKIPFIIKYEEGEMRVELFQC